MNNGVFISNVFSFYIISVSASDISAKLIRAYAIFIIFRLLRLKHKIMQLQ